jgi:hypothetical protein
MAMCKTSVKPISDGFRVVCENLDWTISYVDGERIELGKYSPAGEDFSFTTDTDNFVEGVKEYAAHFNLDEHIEMWIEARHNGVSGVPSTRELVKDAEDIDVMLKVLADALWTAEINSERKVTLG